MNFCPNCGAKNDNPSASFCANCGFKFADAPNNTEKNVDTVSTEPVQRVSWDESDTPETAVNLTGAASDSNSIFEDTSAPLENSTSTSTASKKSISAFDDAVDTSEDIFIVPKGTRVARPVASRTRPERRYSSVFEDEEGSSPAIFAESEELTKETVSSDPSSEFELFEDAQTDDLITSKVEEIKQQINMQENAAAERAQAGALFDEEPSAVEYSESSGQVTRRPARAQRPQQTSAQNSARQENYPPTEPVRRQPTAPPPVFDNNDYEEYDNSYEEYDDYDEEPTKSKKLKKSSNSILPKILVPVLLVIVLVGGFFGFKIMNTPEKAIDAFITAVQTKDITTLQKITRLDNIPTATDANWTALCNGLTQDDNLTLLRAQLTDQITNPKNVDNSFPAIRLVTRTTLGFFKTYKVAATGITLTVPQAQTGTILKLDDVSYTGTAKADNSALDYSNIMPGLYSCQLVGANGSATELRTVSFFTNNDWGSAPLPDGNVAPSTDSGSSETPADSGDATTPTTTAVPSSSEIDSILGSFYTSYLTCLNNQSTSSLTNATDAMRTSVEERMQKTGNKNNTFEYVSATCDASTIQADNETSPTKITFSATFKYNYTPREGGTTESGENVQTVELVNVNGAWVVNSMQTA